MPQVHRPIAKSAVAPFQETLDSEMELKQPANTTAREASPAALPNSASQNAPNSIITRRPRFYGESAAFNFSDESVQTVANAILGEVLHQRYTIAQGVQGTITLVSPNPISPEEALRLRERMEAFAEHGTGKWFSISFKEFIDMPTYVCDMMLEISENMQNRFDSSVNSEELRRIAKEAERKAAEGK